MLRVAQQVVVRLFNCAAWHSRPRRRRYERKVGAHQVRPARVDGARVVGRRAGLTRRRRGAQRSAFVVAQLGQPLPAGRRVRRRCLEQRHAPGRRELVCRCAGGAQSKRAKRRSARSRSQKRRAQAAARAASQDRAQATGFIRASSVVRLTAPADRRRAPHPLLVACTPWCAALRRLALGRLHLRLRGLPCLCAAAPLSHLRLRLSQCSQRCLRLQRRTAGPCWLRPASVTWPCSVPHWPAALRWKARTKSEIPPCTRLLGAAGASALRLSRLYP